jgi:hypothetical protein
MLTKADRTPWVLAACAAALAVAALEARRRLPVVDDPAEPRLALVSIFDGTDLRPTSDRFSGGTIVSVFGGTKLDLRRTSLDDSGASLRITTLSGGANLTVPDEWHVEIDGVTVAGGVRMAGIDQLAGGPTLQIEATTVFGGLRVTGRPVLRVTDASA